MAPVTPPADQELLRAVSDIATAAGAVSQRWFGTSDLDINWKGDGSPVTAADLATETFLREEILRHYPDSTIKGEEHEDTEGSGPLTWIVDPIDGTKAFSRGVPLYSNLITVIDEHGTLVSAINLPALAELVIAGRGLGCFRNGERCHVSDETVPERCVLTTSGYDYWPEPMLRGALASGMQMRTWGDGYGYALVATGRAEAMVDPVVAHWDVAGMDVILTEAGGRFSALDGSPRTDGGTGIGTNGLIHDDLLAQLSG